MPSPSRSRSARLLVTASHGGRASAAPASSSSSHLKVYCRRRWGPRKRRGWTVSNGLGSTDGPAGGTGRCCVAPTARGRYWLSATTPKTPSRGLAVRQRPYASRSMRPPRSTPLGFQPPSIGEEEIAEVTATLRSGWLTTGPRAALLEERMAAYLEAKHVLAVTSGTAALHLALLALGVGPGDEVITSTITWPATANVIEHCGATPVFCDVCEDDLNIDPALIPALVSERTKAIMPVHLAGQPADLDPILALGIPVVEDAAHAAESRYRGRKLGAISDAACFSLYATKNIAAGEGGLVSTDRDDVAAAIGNMRLTRRGDGSLYDQVTAGFKANLSDVLAAIALVQLDKLDAHTRLREQQFALYDDGLAGLEGITPLARDPRDTHALHLYVIRIDEAGAGATRDAYRSALAGELIGTSIHFLPVHRLTWFRDRYPEQPALPVAERAGDEVLSLPLSPAHNDDDILDAIDAVRRVHSRFTA